MIYIGLYLVSATIFSQVFKSVTKNMQNAGITTAIVQIIAGTSVLFFSGFEKMIFPEKYAIIFQLFVVIICNSIADWINTYVRSQIDTSTYSVIKQMSTVFVIVGSIIFFKESIVISRIIGTIVIILSNLLLIHNKKHFELNKVIILALFSNLISAFITLYSVNLSLKFNTAVYVSMIMLGPALLLMTYNRANLDKIEMEVQNKQLIKFIISGISLGIMLLCQFKAYQVNEISIVAPLCSLTVMFNTIFGFIFLNEKKKITQKIIASIAIFFSIYLIKMI
ncbi:MAG: EamA family transporter [Alistipes senegalensis]|nr:EamA family transporter [Alistipes senegalensis]